MGGGDLNLKKSWHPSTMKNMEKVWKAEQQSSQEKKRIAELKRDIEMERDREGMTKFGMEHGTIAQKDDKKLDWMYKGPSSSINREDYLTGKSIDKSFEQITQAERDAEKNKVPSNHVEHECIPPSLRFFTGNEQVDIQRKLQEDPLYAIKKKELESRAQLLKNPVKLKQLRELMSKKRSSPERSSSSSKHKSKRHKESRSKRDEKEREREKEKDKRHHRSKKTKLTDEEREKKLREMMANASWRDKERAKNVKKYRDQEKTEIDEKKFSKDFIRKHLAAAAEEGTVASRIRSNINNIQRSGRAMDTNFARR